MYCVRVRYPGRRVVSLVNFDSFEDAMQFGLSKSSNSKVNIYCEEEDNRREIVSFKDPNENRV